MSAQCPFELRHAQNDVSQLHPQEVSSSGAGWPRALQHRLDSRRETEEVEERDEMTEGKMLLPNYTEVSRQLLFYSNY